MRIAIVNEFFHPDTTGGTGTVLSELGKNLLDMYAEVEIDVITSTNSYRTADHSLPPYEEWEGIRIHRLKTPPPDTASLPKRIYANFRFSMAALRKLLQSPRYDAVIVGTAPPPTPLAAFLYRRVTGTPYLYITYDLEPDRAVRLRVISGRGWIARILKHIQKRWLHSAAKVVVLGRCMRDYIGRHYDLASDQMEIIPIGFNPDMVIPASKRSRFRIVNQLEGFLVLYAGNFGRYHNFDTILDAAKTLQQHPAGITFALVGKGAQREHILKRIAAEAIDNVRVFPFVPADEFSDMLASADACLVTLEQGMEGLCVPSKLYSNMAAGRPTLGMVSPHSEVAYVLTESESGIQINQGDTNQLVQAILRLADCPEEAERLGRNARRTLVENYSSHLIAAHYYTVLCSVAGRQRADLSDFALVSSRPQKETPESLEATGVHIESSLIAGHIDRS